MMIKNILFIIVLIYASYCDIKTRIIPDRVHVMIILLGLIQINIVSSILGLLLVPLPFLVVPLIKSDTLGGGYIKLVGACSFYLGLYGGLLGSGLGLSLAIFVNVIYFKYKGLDDIGKFPLVPYLGWGYVSLGLI